MKLAARIKYLSQFGPGMAESNLHIKQVFEDTTIGDLIEWQRCMFRDDKKIQDGSRIREIRIGPLE